MITDVLKGKIFKALGVEGNIPPNRVVRTKRNLYECGTQDLEYWEKLAKNGYANRTEPGSDTFYVTMKGLKALEEEYHIKLVKGR